jgi:hypothetical protein
MSTLTLLLESLDQDFFDCIEFGDSRIPGRTPGSLRLRRGDDSSTYALSRITNTGGEEKLAPLGAENIEASLAQFTAPVALQSRVARFFPMTLRGSRR